MKKTWSANVDEIAQEIERLINGQAKVFCLREKSKPTSHLVKGKTRFNDLDLLVLSHPSKEICARDQCLFYYHVSGAPARCFYCIPEKVVQGLIGVHYPTEIFEIQRRKFPRVQVPHHSRASFALLHRHGIHLGSIEDISMEGARISGLFPMVLEKGSMITPITFTLMPYYTRQKETAVHIPEATVVWTVKDEDSTREFAIHFNLEEFPQQLEALEHYIAPLLIEEEEESDQ